MTQLNMIRSLNRTLAEEMARDERVLVLGEDVGKEGGVFRVTDGLQERFGEDRVVDTPLAESAIVGASVGLAIGGMRPVAEIQFEGFGWYAFHQIENHVARMRWRSRGRFACPIVIRTPYGAGIRALEHHSESREAYFAHTPGLRVVVPRSPTLARELLAASIRSEDPVVFLEPAALYRDKEDVPEKVEPRALEGADVLREGDGLTIVSYGAMLPRAIDAAKRLDDDGKSAEVIDLVSLAPLDRATIQSSVQKTGRCVIVHEAPLTLGMGAEIAATLADGSIASLQAPVKRVTGYDVPVPLFAREEAYLPSVERILDAAQQVLAY
jgi:pyruvate dehydrogenase E1 component beta subunit